ncbi:MAG TPA: cytochrome P450 [Candidatus Bathyarchaeia archaeon]|nr:cytochrome P450 [Candidatus Bathyarchaeia archaeon]
MISCDKLPIVSGADELTGHVKEFQKDPLALFQRAAREAGDIAHLRFGPYPFYLINHPEYIERILVHDYKKFIKPSMNEWRQLLGLGLITSEGERWMRERKMIQPAFVPRRINAYTSMILDKTRAISQQWQDGASLDLFEEMKKITLSVALQAFFGYKTTFDFEIVTDSLQRIMDYIYDVNANPQKSMDNPMRVAAFEQDIKRLDDMVYTIMQTKQEEAGQEEGEDLLSMLLAKAKEEDNPIGPQQIRDEVITHLIAGYESTATSLAWTFYLLAKHPEAEEALLAEMERVLAGRDPEPADMERMYYTSGVFAESLRLYPPSWSVVRMAAEPFELGEHQFPKGTQVFMSTYVMHRSKTYYDNPDAFRPERWSGGLGRQLPTYAYFPFGGGPRICIGRGLAMLEAFLVIVTLYRDYRFTLVPDRPVEPIAKITLQPRTGIWMTVAKRNTSDLSGVEL